MICLTFEMFAFPSYGMPDRKKLTMPRVHNLLTFIQIYTWKGWKKRSSGEGGLYLLEPDSKNFCIVPQDKNLYFEIQKQNLFALEMRFFVSPYIISFFTFWNNKQFLWDIRTPIYPNLYDLRIHKGYIFYFTRLLNIRTLTGKIYIFILISERSQLIH
jgi:hypothetical protein